MRGAWSGILRRGCIVVSLVTSACVGSIGDDQGDPNGAAPGALCGLPPGRVGLQRLTRAEYNRTVRDLFGVESAPADAFPPDSTTSGFDNNAQSLTTSPQLAELLFDAAELVAGEALTNKKDEIFVCDPDQVGFDACARTTLAQLALRVYRRPPLDAEIDDLMASMLFAQTEGDTFEQGVGYALQAMLTAPQFLYRGVPVDVEDAAAVTELDDYALATRLSYFLWGSTPDDLLLQSAADGRLRDPEGLRGEFERLLADPKSVALFDGFVNQWLKLGMLASASPDPALFPAFDDDLRQAMADEARLFFDALRQRDGSALELINGNYTFANEALGAIYGVSVDGSALEQVATDPSRRAGVLTMPAILTMTSGPASPNIVRRGVWLAETILCAKPPPPPEGVPAPPDPQPGETERERLERHRSDPSCASCHNLIDPLGFAFDNYDALGNWRETADGEPVDNQGQLPDGRTFAGVVGLVELLETGDEYPTCVTEKLMTYALGRTTTEAEQCLLSAIGTETVHRDSRLSDLLWAVVTSDAFRKQDGAGGQ